jgi:hypothetical protein
LSPESNLGIGPLSFNLSSKTACNDMPVCSRAIVTMLVVVVVVVVDLFGGVELQLI